MIYVPLLFIYYAVQNLVYGVLTVTMLSGGVDAGQVWENSVRCTHLISVSIVGKCKCGSIVSTAATQPGMLIRMKSHSLVLSVSQSRDSTETPFGLSTDPLWCTTALAKAWPHLRRVIAAIARYTDSLLHHQSSTFTVGLNDGLLFYIRLRIDDIQHVLIYTWSWCWYSNHTWW